MSINNEELEIFARQLILKEFSESVFKKLQSKEISIVGIGGIGCPTSQYLIASGIKKINLFDNDVVKKNNLNRQLLFSISDLGKKKCLVAKNRLLQINPNLDCCSYETNIDINNLNLLKNSEIIIDATDDWNSMQLINKYCVKNNIPLISSSVIGFDAQIILFENLNKKHFCLKCLFPNNNEPELARCDTIGILGTAAGLTGLITAQKTLNFLLKFNNEKNILTLLDTKKLTITNVKTKTNHNCELLKSNLK